MKIKKLTEGLAFNRRYKRIREPKVLGAVEYNRDTESNVIRELNAYGIKVEDITVDPVKYRKYFESADYLGRYPKYYPWNIKEKSLEHFVASELLGLNKEDVYIDIASENSCVPAVYGALFGCKSYAQDLSFPKGLHGDRIGGSAANMPVPDGFATKMALHCSLEHFEEDADMDFIKESSRVLKKGGRCCIVPLYLFDRYAIQTDPGVSNKEDFEKDAVVYCAKGWNNRHGRFYDPEHLKSRIIDNLKETSFNIFRITNAKEIDSSCYARFALLFEKK